MIKCKKSLSIQQLMNLGHPLQPIIGITAILKNEIQSKRQ